MGVTPLRRCSGPSRHRLAFSRFPGSAGYTTDLLHRLLDGTRTVSPVARHALVTVLPLTTPPEWQAASSARGLSCCLRPEREGSAPGIIFCRGHHWVHLRYGPVTRSPSPELPWRKETKAARTSIIFPSRNFIAKRISAAAMPQTKRTEGDTTKSEY